MATLGRSLATASAASAVAGCTPRRPVAAHLVPRSTESRAASHQRTITVVVGGEEFELPKPFLALHSPILRRHFKEEPTLERLELTGDADSFRAFVRFLQGAPGPDGEVTADNLHHLLHWAAELHVEYVKAMCEEMLFLRPPTHLQHAELLDLAARHDMPLLYKRATESLAHGALAAEVSGATDAELPEVLLTKDIREDVVNAHISMGTVRNDIEGCRMQRFADLTRLEDRSQRARLTWKSHRRAAPPPKEAPPHNWRSLQSVWPHHSLRGDDWVVVPMESQPTMPLRSHGIAAASGAVVSLRRKVEPRRKASVLASRPWKLEKESGPLDSMGESLSTRMPEEPLER
mmetsp:Transcript_122414/g.346050  ORF Transcript_122414/g.346050 Transcript_122414/m.346050 type:complete len:347 (-) Transcript_122414:185-1225(-)